MEWGLFWTAVGAIAAVAGLIYTLWRDWDSIMERLRSKERPNVHNIPTESKFNRKSKKTGRSHSATKIGVVLGLVAGLVMGLEISGGLGTAEEKVYLIGGMIGMFAVLYGAIGRLIDKLIDKIREK